MGKTYKTGRRTPFNMPKTREELVKILNNPKYANKLEEAAAHLYISKVTLCAWMRHYGVERVSYYK